MQSLRSFLEQHDILLRHPEPIVACTVAVKKHTKSDTKKSFIDMLMEILNIEDRNSISMSSTFSQLGIDSLAGIEMQQMIEKEYNTNFGPNELRSLTIAELEAKINANINQQNRFFQTIEENISKN